MTEDQQKQINDDKERGIADLIIRMKAQIPHLEVPLAPDSVTTASRLHTVPPRRGAATAKKTETVPICSFIDGKKKCKNNCKNKGVKEGGGYRYSRYCNQHDKSATPKASKDKNESKED